MAESAREQVLAKIVVKLQGMIGTRHWGGSYENAPTVERVYKTSAQVTQYPHLVVLASSGSTVAIEESGGGNALYRHDFKVLVTGYVRGDDTVLQETWRERLWHDVVLTLLGAATLDGLARELTPAGEGTEVDEGELGPIGAFAQIFTVIIDEAFTVA